MSYPRQYAQFTPPPPPPRRNNAGKVIGIGCAGFFALAVFGGFVAAITDSDGPTDEKPSAKAEAAAPPYEVVEQEDNGSQRNVVVEVNSTDDLRAVFDDVIKGLSDEAGYYVSINCSTGGTKGSDNRLANGRYAVGRTGSAVTGMEEGGTEFSTNKDRSCPDAEPVKKPQPPKKEKKEKPEAPTSYGDGDYQVGVDIQPGTYISKGAQKGLFELCSASTKPTDGSFGEWETANADEQVILIIGANSGVVSISGCEPFVLRK